MGFNLKDGLREEVSWTKFVNAFTLKFPIPAEIESLGLHCLEAILAHEPVGWNIAKDKLVSMVYFGKVLQWFGPLKGTPHIIEKLISVMKKGYFHGDMTKDEAYVKLKRLPSGSFLIRLGHSEPGGYAVSRVREKSKGVKEVLHMRIQYINGKFSLHEKIFDDLDALIKACEDRYKMKHACLGSAFASLFEEGGASQKHNYYDESDGEEGSDVDGEKDQVK